MTLDIVHKCAICEADFRPGALDNKGKCASCRVEFPTAKNKKEAMALNAPEINLGAKLDEDKVRQIIREELSEFKAGIKADQLKADKKSASLEKARAAKAAKVVDGNKVEASE